MIHYNVTDSPSSYVVPSEKGRKVSLQRFVEKRKAFHSDLYLEILNSARGRVKMIIEHRKQLRNAMLIITSRLPFESAADADLATSFEVLLGY